MESILFEWGKNKSQKEDLTFLQILIFKRAGQDTYTLLDIFQEILKKCDNRVINKRYSNWFAAIA